MNYGVHNNMALINANGRLKVNAGNRAKSAEKLSTGYRINRSADDAAGLAISEKMRWQLRGLNRGTLNGQEGVSWVQTGDGALEEVHALLQRMRELTIQSLNDTNTEEDRAACQAEFDSLQSEIDRITGTTQFNTQNIFDEHELPYYQCEGNAVWPQSQLHTIGTNNNDLTIKYRETATGAVNEVSFTVPAGTYTTQELIDEMEDAIIANGLDEKGIMFEFTENGTCNLNLEGGEMIDTVGGGLSYLLYEMYTGGGFGALVGTTTFTSEYARLEIGSENNNLSFDIESFDGSTSQNVNITISDGRYTRQELIDILNTELAGTDVTATEYGSGIKLAGKNSIVTGFKGNMFKIDEGLNVYHSVFYDNVKYGTISNMKAAEFTGGAIKSTSSLSSEYAGFEITTSNNELIIGANGDAPVTLTIPPKTYDDIDDLVTELNTLFDDNDLELDAVVYTYGSYQGIKITSEVLGVTSKVEVDAASSAYETLFVKRVNNVQVESPRNESDSRKDSLATVTGKKLFTTSNGKLPLTITSGVNDQFTLTLTDTAGAKTNYTITIDDNSYTALDDIIDNINQQLTAAGINDKVEAVDTTDGAVKLTAKTGSGLTGVDVSQTGSNTGYKDIFVLTTISYTTKTVTESGTSTTPAQIELEQTFADETTFDSSNNKLNINVNGTNYTVTFPTDVPQSKQDIENTIDNALKEEVVVANNTFTTVNGQGTTTSSHFTRTDDGTTDVRTGTYSDTGYSEIVQGTVGGYSKNEPATIKMNYATPSSIYVDDTHNVLQISINGVEKQLVLDTGLYTKGALVNKIQSLIDGAFTTYCGGAVVSLDNDDKLVFTARMNHPDGSTAAGIDTSIACNTSTSSLLELLHTVESAATIKSGKTLQNSITIENGKNTFVFSYEDADGSNQNVTLNLTAVTYNRQSFVNELNKKLTAGGYGVTAAVDSSGYLSLTTKDVGDDTSISFSTSNGGTAVESVFGPMVTETAASKTANCDIQEEIVIDADSQDFNVIVGGNPVNVKLDIYTYDRDSFVKMLDQKLEGTGLSATLDGNRIKYTTDAVGSTATFSVSYATGGSSMLAIYGQTTTVKPGVDASFTADGKLVLTGTQNGGTLKVTSSAGNKFLESTEVVNESGPTTQTGYASSTYAYIDGASLSEPIEISSLNNTLKFSYMDGGTAKTADITLTEKTYATYDELRAELQTAIDNSSIGAGEIEVSVTAAGVVIKALEPGSTHYLTGFSGGFYDRVLYRTEKRESNQGVTNRAGSQIDDEVYTIGRKSIRNSETLIRSGINDTLTLDFSYGTNEKTFTLTLAPGTYSDTALVNALQEKLDEQLEAADLEPGTIEVGIGGVNSGVSGSNDNNALVFKLSTDVKLPDSGQYIIDGVSGNAAFSIFYQTEGELEPAYISGSKDITEGVTIKPGENELSFVVDGTDSYTISLTEKDYTAQELIDEMNAQLGASGAPVFAEAYGNTVRLVYATMGEHRISDISGSAKEEIFFQENGEIGERTGVMIQLSSNKGSDLEIDRPIVNTSYLGINSVAITRPKYANKALVRLDEAIDRVSEVRSHFGSIQNRLEHAIANNENTSENVQAAESRLRDTDMANEMVNQAKYNILQQVTESMMAQGKVSAEGVLRLLQM